ncbi:MAG: hypothetical protein GW795_00710 [Cyanobacteria bacterium]|nr:hypothetical protein [Cyanobacteria bacterium CG_2015-16_32_12]NCO77859.1 hypothetical protein [Cyanobacteria bacterium CG_2015-22_32_23]NCQ03458.1 hypothetical protein [Cyanobacteria bacterium CG_2015-09_32_10]NCQ40431.1 hypothetical protein [Cyanobacteria bacterium CG_2015-04_32_10]NCS84710.1 hypothetical protein [Cyanobacteria bacterium CG_2015-02_32_10]
MNSHHLFKHFQKKELITLKKSKVKIFIISLLWFIFWMLIYAICAFIQPELIFLPMALNLPLASFFCLGIIIESLSIYFFNYDQSYDLIAKLMVILFTYSLNYLYRQVIFKETKSIKLKIKSRIKEFFIWLIPSIIIILIVGKITHS